MSATSGSPPAASKPNSRMTKNGVEKKSRKKAIAAPIRGSISAPVKTAAQKPVHLKSAASKTVTRKHVSSNAVVSESVSQITVQSSKSFTFKSLNRPSNIPKTVNDDGTLNLEFLEDKEFMDFSFDE